MAKKQHSDDDDIKDAIFESWEAVEYNYVYCAQQEADLIQVSDDMMKKYKGRGWKKHKKRYQERIVFSQKEKRKADKSRDTQNVVNQDEGLDKFIPIDSIPKQGFQQWPPEPPPHEAYVICQKVLRWSPFIWPAYSPQNG